MNQVQIQRMLYKELCLKAGEKWEMKMAAAKTKVRNISKLISLCAVSLVKYWFLYHCNQ